VLKSLQARLIVAAALVLAMCGVLAAVGSYRAAILEADEILDAHLAQLTQTLLFLSRADLGRSAGDIGVDDSPRHGQTVFQVWQVRDIAPRFAADAGRWLDPRPFPRLLLRSGAADSAALFARPDGYSEFETAGRMFRVHAQTSADGAFRVVVGEDLIERQEMVRGIALSNIRPYLWIVPLGLVALIVLIYRSLGPIRRLTDEIAARDPARLAPLAIGAAPSELEPLIRALNTLLERLNLAIDNERRFTGDAAHELRNPMAALRAQLDALRLASDKETRMQAQHQAAATAERLVRLVNQLLTLARLDRSGQLPSALTDLADIAREQCADIGPEAVRKNVDLSLHAVPTQLHAEEDACRILLRNLLENAVRHVPEGGRVEVNISHAAGLARLVVADNGPGVPRAKIRQLGQRFNRVGETATDGVGLGLSIVMRVVERHRGRITFGRGIDRQGLAVTVELPRALRPEPAG
jgi:signal transduction histidine kinase